MFNPKYKDKYRINSARCVSHGYNIGEYFITICTKNHDYYFGHIEMNAEDVPQMMLSEVGQYLQQVILNIHNHYADVSIPEYVIMPNHIHLIVTVYHVNTSSASSSADICAVETTHASSSADICGVETTHASSSAEIGGGDTTHASSLQGVDAKMRDIMKHRGRLSDAIGSIKSSVTKYAHLHGITFAWQSRFYDCIIRNQNEKDAYVHYIGYNIINWGIDEYNKHI